MKAPAGDRRDRLRAMLADLKMPGALEAVDGILAQADSGAVTASEAIEELLSAQILLRNNRRLQAAMRSSRLPAVKTLDQFDFSFQPGIKREQIESLHERGFLQRAENVILLGPPRVGKTHLAISLAIAAAESRREVYYGTLAALIESLTEAKAAGNLSRRLRVLTHPALLVVDEIGYLPISQDGAVLFLQLINARHERASTVLTSNKGFEEWGGVLGDEIMAAALIDRLLHQCHIVNIRGNSYRAPGPPPDRVGEAPRRGGTVVTANPLAAARVRYRPPVAPLPTADTGAHGADRTAATASPTTDEVGHFQLPQVGHSRLPLTRRLLCREASRHGPAGQAENRPSLRHSVEQGQLRGGHLGCDRGPHPGSPSGHAPRPVRAVLHRCGAQAAPPPKRGGSNASASSRGKETGRRTADRHSLDLVPQQPHHQAVHRRRSLLEVGQGMATSRAAASSAKRFLDRLIEQAPLKVKAIQVDGGGEFMADFEHRACEDQDIELCVLPPRSPQLNGCVERLQATYRH